ncbi:MAG: hypothetical protein KAT46_04705 [Deltaproteobacteria bacterium]|nr:hypothetical protein [Deltaproteobacteria bacterium]
MNKKINLESFNLKGFFVKAKSSLLSFVVVSFLTVILTSCGGASSGASSLTKKDYLVKYPKSSYLVGEGIGQSESEARSNAKAELTRIFESRIMSDTLDSIKASIGPGFESVEQSITSDVRVSADMEVKGLEIGGTWKEADTGTHHAIAVLDRTKGRDLYMADLNNIDTLINAELKAQTSMKGRLLPYRSMKKILNVWVERAVVVSRLRVLGRSNTSTSYNIKDVFNKVAELKSTLPIYVEITSEDTESSRLLAEFLSSALADKGYVLTKDKTTAEALVTGNVSVTEAVMHNPGWEFALAKGSVALSEPGTDINVVEVAGEQRGSDLSFERATYKSLKKLSKVMATKMIDSLEKGE